MDIKRTSFFLVDVEELRKLKDSKDISEKIVEMWRQYQGDMKQIPEQTRKRLETSIMRNSNEQNIFDEAYNEIKALLEPLPLYKQLECCMINALINKRGNFKDTDLDDILFTKMLNWIQDRRFWELATCTNKRHGIKLCKITEDKYDGVYLKGVVPLSIPADLAFNFLTRVAQEKSPCFWLNKCSVESIGKRTSIREVRATYLDLHFQFGIAICTQKCNDDTYMVLGKTMDHIKIENKKVKYFTKLD